MASTDVSRFLRTSGSVEQPLLTRRALLRSGAAAAAMFTLGGSLQGCGSGSAGAHPAAASRFEPSPGAEIPLVDVRFAMWPFGDTTIGFVGIKQGFFKDVGINVVPEGGETRLVDQTPGELLSGQLEIASGNMAIEIQSFPDQPEIKMIQLHDTYVGNYLLASPQVGAKTYEYFAKSGKSFEEAAKSAVRQIRGRRVALSTTGANRDFFTALLGIAGLRPQDFKLTVIDDTRILQLARAGDVDFALPGGAAQNVVLLKEGFSRVFGTRQLLKNLPLGDPRAVGSVSDGGLVALTEYVNTNTETVLRFMSVFYRIIDQLHADPDSSLAIVLPHLNAATGLTLTLRDCKVLFSQFYEFFSFEQTADHLLNRHFPLQLDNVYVPQIEAAKKGGIYAGDRTVTPEDIFVGKRLYEILVELKRRYERFNSSHILKPDVATKAKEQYNNRNYLDAYRLLRSATSG